MAIPNRYFDGRARAAPAGVPDHRRARATRARRSSTRALPDAVHPPGRRVGRLHRRGRASALHGARVPASSTGTASPSSPSRPRTSSARAIIENAGRRLRHPRRLEPARQRRRVGRAGARGGRPRRRGLGRRLVQLHRPAQPDAAGLQQRQGQRLRDAAARQDARPHLPRRLPRRAGRRRRRRCRRPIPAGLRRGAQERQHVLAAARAAAARRARQDGRRAAAGRARRANTTVDAIGTNGARVPRAVDAAGLGAHHRDDRREAGRAAVRRAEASGRRRPQGGGDGAAGTADEAATRDPRREAAAPIRICTRGSRRSSRSPRCRRPSGRRRRSTRQRRSRRTSAIAG